eukprot:TRINITY_DN4140_c0_g2_i1.p1 TRINITY_DN4140_c0_g2~~TRINITY_DN4140_c0_g2_i1.p1  ORF type:complete len:500 (+),score=141.85 TRINITY_DN4140_c0_g2_i1:94-1500(+)
MQRPAARPHWQQQQQQPRQEPTTQTSMSLAAELVRAERLQQLYSNALHYHDFIASDEDCARKQLVAAQKRSKRDAECAEAQNAVYVECVASTVLILDEESSERDDIQTARDGERAKLFHSELQRERAHREEADRIVRAANSAARDRHCVMQLDEAIALCREALNDIAASQRKHFEPAPPDFERLSAADRVRVAAEMLHAEIARGELYPELQMPTDEQETALRKQGMSPRRVFAMRQAVHPAQEEDVPLTIGCRARVRNAEAISGGSAIHAGRLGTVVSFDQDGDPVLHLEGGGQVLFYLHEVVRDRDAERYQMSGSGAVRTPQPAARPWHGADGGSWGSIHAIQGQGASDGLSWELLRYRATLGLGRDPAQASSTPADCLLDAEPRWTDVERGHASPSPLPPCATIEDVLLLARQQKQEIRQRQHDAIRVDERTREQVALPVPEYHPPALDSGFDAPPEDETLEVARF